MSRAWREVDLDALTHNARVLQGALAPGCRLMAVVKADAYGHGAFPVAHRLEAEGIQAFAVACLAEGMDLRRMGIRGKILILGYTPPEEAPLLCRWRLTQTVVDEHHGQALAAQGLPLAVHLALDTGMHRLGIPAKDHGALERLYALPQLRIEGVFSHLCVSDSLEAEDMAFTRLQLERFYGAVRWLRGHGYDPGETHIQASYGIWNLPPQPCTWARAGIALYGVTSDGSPTARELDLRPALALRARVASVRTLSPGEGAGYGLAFRAEGPVRLAAVTIGYADGLPRLCSDRWQVELGGRRAPILGRVCMDMCMADVTGLEVAPGDEAEVFGERLPVEELAALAGTIQYELLCAVSPRVWREYRG